MLRQGNNKNVIDTGCIVVSVDKLQLIVLCCTVHGTIVLHQQRGEKRNNENRFCMRNTVKSSGEMVSESLLVRLPRLTMRLFMTSSDLRSPGSLDLSVAKRLPPINAEQNIR
jgi:hypothetical protein